MTNVAAVGGAATAGVNVNYFMTIKDNFSNCSVATPQCVDAKGTLSDPVAGLRVVAVRCFEDAGGTTNVDCAGQVKSVRLIKGVMETIWPGGAGDAQVDAAGVLRDYNPTVQSGNVGGLGASAGSSDDAGRPIVFKTAGALSGQPISVKATPTKALTEKWITAPVGGTIKVYNSTTNASVAYAAGATPTDIAAIIQKALRTSLSIPSAKVLASGNTLSFNWDGVETIKFGPVGSDAYPTYLGLPSNPAASPFSAVPLSGRAVVTATVTITDGGTLDVSAVAAGSGSLFVGQTVQGGALPAGTRIKAFVSGTGGPGTYLLSSGTSITAITAPTSFSVSASSVQGSDVLRIGGTSKQDLDGNWAIGDTGCATSSGTANDTNGCGAEVVGVPIQTLSNPNCNGLATTSTTRTRKVPGATGNASFTGANGPGSNSDAAGAVPFSDQSHGACFMGGPGFESATPSTVVYSPRINNQLLASAGATNPRLVTDIPAQSLEKVAGLKVGDTDNIALLVYLPSWSTQRTPDAEFTGAVTVANNIATLTVTVDTDHPLSGTISVGQTLYGVGVPDGMTVTAKTDATHYTVSGTTAVTATTISAVNEASPTSLVVKTCAADSNVGGSTLKVQVPCGGAGSNGYGADGKANPTPASYTVAFTAVEPVGVTFTGNNLGAERSSLVPVGQARDVNGTVFAMNAPLVPDNAVLGSNGSGA
ncbi:MAG: hypothetical protein EBT09_09285, partial [Actinobacteria bacterium]|nr:hypothetical protein [Actinomycetota bacterium]